MLNGLLMTLLLWASVESRLVPDAPIDCDACAEWNRAQEPFRLFGDTYFVGVRGLSAILIASDEGLILVDGGLPQSAARIDASIRELGFRTEDIRLIVSSHAHFDHAGGLAALQRASGAPVAASPASARALRRGMATEDDPQYGYGESDRFPAVSNLREIRDGETLTVGKLSITAHFTPGHTPGGTSWTWRACEGERCLDLVYADSLSAVSASGFRFTGDDAHPSLVERFRESISTVASLPCDILVSTHPGLSGLFEKLARREKGMHPDALVDEEACRAYAAAATKTLDERIEKERAEAR